MDSVTSDLIAFITARLNDDEQGARAALEPNWRPDGATSCQVYAAHDDGSNRTIAWCGNGYDDDFANALHIARHDPARVLRELEAKRGLLAEHEKALTVRREHPGDLAASGWVLGTIRALKLVALPYADHPDYQAKWAP